MKPILSAFVLELSAFLALAALLLMLMGVPALWAFLAMFIVFDVGVILFLSQDPVPPVRRVSMVHDRLLLN
jgi:hypothetical protein